MGNTGCLHVRRPNSVLGTVVIPFQTVGLLQSYDTHILGSCWKWFRTVFNKCLFVPHWLTTFVSQCDVFVWKWCQHSTLCGEEDLGHSIPEVSLVCCLVSRCATFCLPQFSKLRKLLRERLKVLLGGMGKTSTGAATLAPHQARYLAMMCNVCPGKPQGRASCVLKEPVHIFVPLITLPIAKFALDIHI